MNYFSGKIIWITGASSGIGEKVALQLARQKAILILSSYDKAELEVVKNKCTSLGAECTSLVFDLQFPDQVSDAAKNVLGQFKKIDMLFNIAGLSQRALVQDTPLEIDRKIMEINYFGAIALTKAVLPGMIAQKSGHIVAVSSIAGKFGFPLRSAYSAAKHAIYGFFETLRFEMASHNVNVTIACPGRVQTNISLHALTATGEAHGKMDDGQNTGISAEECARQLIKAVENRKREILIGKKELWMVHIKKWLPFLFYRIVNKIKHT